MIKFPKLSTSPRRKIARYFSSFAQLVLFMLIFALSGCGSRGDLYLPDNSKPTTHIGTP